MATTYSTQATTGLRNLAQSLSAGQQPPLCCPDCKVPLRMECSGRNGRWSARHPRSSTCKLDLACWGNGATEDELRAQFAAGVSPRQANPQTVAIVQAWVARLCLINDRRNNDR